jgi:hypothetical protein
LEDVKLFSDDKVAAYAWTVEMRDLGARNTELTDDYWLNQVILKYHDPVDQMHLLADIDALLLLQSRNPLSPSDERIREQNEKALQRAREGQR